MASGWGNTTDGDAWGAGPGHTNEGNHSAADGNWGVEDAVPENYESTAFDDGAKLEHDDSGIEDVRASDKCFGCGETGHRRAECPNPQEMTCRYCKKEGHMVRDCPDKPPMICENCGEEGHFRKNCENARKINRDHVADIDPDEAWKKIQQAVAERDVDDAKEAVQEYVKAVDGKVTYRELQEALIDQNINLWLIAAERPLLAIFTNMDLQGNMGKKYTISYRFNEKPDRPREIDGWPQNRDEILSRLDDAGEVVNTGKQRCSNCSEIGHISKDCPQDKFERADKPKISCFNCGEDGHRVRDCPQPRVDKFACKNCGKSGHKAAECEEPPNPANVECRKCNEIGHFAKDCPQGGGRACRNCGEEGHIARECEKPRNPDNVTCRNCDQMGHFSRDCPEPKDWSKVQCNNCLEYGHTKTRCKKLPAESEAVVNDDFQGGFDDTVPLAEAGHNSGDGADGPSYEADQWNSGGW